MDKPYCKTDTHLEKELQCPHSLLRFLRRSGWRRYWYDQEENSEFFTDNWVDISTTGTNMGPGDDTSWFAGTLNFDFVFYGEESNDIYIGSNGTIVFRDVYLARG